MTHIIFKKDVLWSPPSSLRSPVEEFESLLAINISNAMRKKEVFFISYPAKHESVVHEIEEGEKNKRNFVAGGAVIQVIGRLESVHVGMARPL